MGFSLTKLIGNSAVQLWAARLAVRWLPHVRLGKTVVFARWDDVQEILSRDLDFLIEPINKERIERVNGPFVLGMDRSAMHLQEREALYQALRVEDTPRIAQLAIEQAQGVLQDVPKGGSLDVVGAYARLVASRSATALMGVQGASEAEQMRVARAMFHESFLNLNGDQKVQQKAVELSAQLQQWVDGNIAAHHQAGSGAADDMISRMIAAGCDDGLIRRTVSGMFVGAIDTTATCVANIMDVVLKRPSLQRAMEQDVDDPIRMRGWCYDALRFRPHNPIMFREAARDCVVGGKVVKAGSRVVCFTLAAMHDAAAFPDPSQAEPTRPIKRYLHFGGGLHVCAGRAINGVQIPLLVGELLRRKPVHAGAMTFDGPFPDQLTVTLQA